MILLSYENRCRGTAARVLGKGAFQKVPLNQLYLGVSLSEPFDWLTILTAVNDVRKRNAIYLNPLLSVNPPNHDTKGA